MSVDSAASDEDQDAAHASEQLRDGGAALFTGRERAVVVVVGQLDDAPRDAADDQHRDPGREPDEDDLQPAAGDDAGVQVEELEDLFHDVANRRQGGHGRTLRELELDEGA